MSATGSSSEALIPTIASYVQLRGSVPLLWSELPNLKYKPTRVSGYTDEGVYTVYTSLLLLWSGLLKLKYKP